MMASQALDALRAQLEAMRAQIDATLIQLEAIPEGACPQCGESERLENTAAMGEPVQLTCQLCGFTWVPGQREEVDNG